MDKSKVSSDKYWDEIIQEFKASGLSLRNFCNAKGITNGALRYHLYDKPKAKTASEKKKKIKEVELVPVSIKHSGTVYSSSIEIRLPVNASIIVDGTTDLQLLKQVLEGLS